MNHFDYTDKANKSASALSVAEKIKEFQKINKDCEPEKLIKVSKQDAKVFRENLRSITSIRRLTTDNVIYPAYFESIYRLSIFVFNLY